MRLISFPPCSGSRVACLAGACLLAGLSHAQSTSPAAFVANNGNIRGSVTSFTINPDGTLNRVQELVLGAASGDPGVNAYAISISPSGEFLAVSHTTSATVWERISLLRVHPDATISLAANLQTPDSPLDLTWVTNDLLAVTRTRTSGTNEVILYRFNPQLLTITEVSRVGAGAFCSKLALSPDRRVLISNDSPLSGGSLLRSFLIDHAAGTLTFRGAAAPGTGYALGQSFSPDGLMVYCGSGSATTQGYVGAVTVNPETGDIAPHFSTPFFDYGSSPKQVVVSPDGRFLHVGHGSDSTIRRHEVDPESGIPTDTGMMYDVGIQGSLGDMAAVRIKDAGGQALDLLLFTDKETYDGTPRGLFSARINADGSLTILTERLDTLGVAPNDIAVWAGPAGASCDADVNCDGSTDGFDVEAMEQAVGGDMTNFCQADTDFNGDGSVDGFDVESVEQVVGGAPCP